MHKDYRQLIKLSNELSLDDLIFLMNCFSERIFVAFEKDKITVCADLDKTEPFVINGTSIQINVEKEVE